MTLNRASYRPLSSFFAALTATRSTLFTTGALTALLACSNTFAAPSLTIYNGNFAVVRDTLELPVNKGANRVQYQNITRLLEPDSVVLRSRKDDWKISIQEQNFLANVVSEPLLLHYFEGKTIDFEVLRDQQPVIVPGKIIRSGYDDPGNSPIIEMEGKTRFGLPGRPLFPALKDDTLLKPALQWQLESSQAGNAPLEIAYLTGGMNWKADYNIIATDNSDKVSLNGWVTFTNNAGQDFSQATVKLMAGDVNKVEPAPQYRAKGMVMAAMEAPAPAVTEKALDEFHLYSLPRKLDLRDGETKQVEFLNVTGVKAKKLFVYDGAAIPDHYRFQSPQDIRNDPNYGTQSNTKVWIMREFKNAKDNGLGVPLPKGRVRFYQQDEQQLEFIGENNIDHTPKDETVRLYTGNAFDIVGERERTDYQINTQEQWLRESFKITLKNRKQEKASVKVVEHLYRWNNWALEKKSQDFEKKNADTIEFNVSLNHDEEKVVTYTARYSW
ncbi:MAG TPA: DUF4139 domain-containing protein [Candidatus Kapabacteria bacterium]|nr:DUF4139 domain-containing protein [Candidatus Kapabacteria bacterium]